MVFATPKCDLSVGECKGVLVAKTLNIATAQKRTCGPISFVQTRNCLLILDQDVSFNSYRKTISKIYQLTTVKKLYRGYPKMTGRTWKNQFVV